MLLEKIRSAIGGGKGTKKSADRRRFFRIPEERASVVIDDVSYPLCDWNHRGFMAAPYSGRLKPGFRITTRLIIPHSGDTHGFNADAVVVRVDPDTDVLAATFYEMDAETKQRLREHSNDKIGAIKRGAKS